MAAPSVSDRRRDALAAALFAALLALYARRAATVARKLGVSASAPSLAARRKIRVFAQDRAALIQQGINQRFAAASDQQQSRESILQEIEDYHAKTLIPFLAAWAAHQALSDTYADTPSPDGGSMRDAVSWVWTRGSGSSEPDSCGAAQDASPAAYDTLIGIAGGEPPIHPNCQCSLDPA